MDGCHPVYWLWQELHALFSDMFQCDHDQSLLIIIIIVRQFIYDSADVGRAKKIAALN